MRFGDSVVTSYCHTVILTNFEHSARFWSLIVMAAPSGYEVEPMAWLVGKATIGIKPQSILKPGRHHLQPF
jgi:hypothetical protein